MYVHTYVCVYIYICIYVNVYVCIYIYITDLSSTHISPTYNYLYLLGINQLLSWSPPWSSRKLASILQLQIQRCQQLLVSTHHDRTVVARSLSSTEDPARTIRLEHESFVFVVSAFWEVFIGWCGCNLPNQNMCSKIATKDMSPT